MRQTIRAIIGGLLVIGGAVILLSCQSDSGRHQRTYEERLNEARSALHAGEIERARRVLVKLEEQYPGEHRTRVTLASVSIREAGLSIDQFYSFAEAMVAHLVEESPWTEPWWLNQDPLKSENELSASIQKFLSQLFKVTARLTQFFYLFEQLPRIDSVQKGHLRDALMLLDQVPLREKGTALFRATLRAVLLKEKLPNPLEVVAWVEDCQTSFDGLAKKIDEVWSITKVLLVDLKAGTGNNSLEVETWQKEGDAVIAFIQQRAQATPEQNFSGYLLEQGLSDIRTQWGCE